MRSWILAALATVALASPIPGLLPRQTVCVPPGKTADGLTGPFYIQVSGDTNTNGNFAGTIPKRNLPFIAFAYSSPNAANVQEFYLNPSGQLLSIANGVTSYAYNDVPPRYISLSTDPTVKFKITCTIDDTTCDLNCKLPGKGGSTNCLGSPKVDPEWRIGAPSVVTQYCLAFQPVVVASGATSAA